MSATWSFGAGRGIGRRTAYRARREPEMLEPRQLLTVVISEFMAVNQTTLVDEDGSTSDWLELRNTGPQSQNLDGWYLTDKVSNLTKWKLPNVVLDPDEHLIVFASEKDRDVAGSELHTNFKLSGDGEYLALVEPDGQTVAHEYAPEFPAQSADISFGLSSDLSHQGYFTSPTPGQLNLLDPIANESNAIVINELMYHLPRTDILDAENSDEEYIELHNRGPQSINLNGWRFSRGVGFDFPSVSIPADGYLVVAADVDSFKAKYPAVANVIGGWTGVLSNNGETVELSNEIGTVIDSVRYASEGDWGVRAAGPQDRGHTGWIWNAGHDGNGKSMELANPALPNENGQNWSSSATDGGSPGVANSNHAANIAPLISNVRHSPAIPHSDETVTVTATLADESSGAFATLRWRIDTDASFQSIEMTDDGRQADEVAGDGVFSASIPAHENLTVIEFFVEAQDSGNRTRTWPAPNATGNQTVNALYQVFDDFDEDVPWTPGAAPIYFQIMTNAERSEFTDIDRRSNAQFNATFISVDGAGVEIRYNAGVRIRGSASRNNNVPSNRITIPNDRPFKDATRLNLNATNVPNQVSASALFRLAGIEAPSAHGVRMFSNGTALRGLYAHIEVLDSDYAQNHYPHDSEGNVYRGRRPDESPPGGQGAGLDYFGSDPAPYVSYVKNSNSSKADWSDVIELTDILENASDEVYVESVERVANVDQWFQAFAMNSLLGNTEFGLFTGDPLGDDYAMYRGVHDVRFEMLPYDLDTMYANGNQAIDRPTRVPTLDRLINHPAFRHRYYGAYLDLIDNVVLTDKANQIIDESLRNIASNNRINEIKTYLQNRAEVVRSRIWPSLVVTTDVGGNDPIPRTTEPGIVIQGRAPEAHTTSVTVNGLPADSLDAEREFTFNAGNVRTEVGVLVPRGSTWRYLDDGSNQGTAWRAPDFQDDSWASGRAQLGYGDGDEVTVVDNGPGDTSAATTYFRGSFDVSDVDQITELNMLVKYDDGVVVYLNGVEVARDNLPADPSFDQFATGSRFRDLEDLFEPFAVSSDLLVEGENVFAVEVHQDGPNSPDISFDLELSHVRRFENPAEAKLHPGLNRFIVEAHRDDDTEASARRSIDIWYDDGDETTITEDISTDTVWTAEEGPYRINENITIASGATLSIEPGTSVFFGNNGRLTIRGRLVAIGERYDEVRFSRNPNSNQTWDGLQFRDSMEDNRIEHAIIEYGRTNDGMIGLEDSRLTIENSILDNTDLRRIRSIDSSLVVRDSTFTNIFDPGEAPTTNNRNEHIWGRGIPANGEWILEGNTFGHITGHNDSIDFDAPSLPNPIPIIRNNLFVGGGDDALDMTGDVWIQENTFRSFVKDEFNTDPGESNTISSSGGTFWVIGNVFDGSTHAALIKENAFMNFYSNTVVNSRSVPLYFDLPGETSGPGRGAHVRDSIFAGPHATFDFVQPDTDLTVEYSLLPTSGDDILGIGNQFGDAHVNAVFPNYAPLIGSPAINAGSNGQDLGATSGAGATISGEPPAVTSSRNARLTIGGPAITHYRYRLDGGAFSGEFSIDQPLEITGLTGGAHFVEVIGRNELGIWQAETNATRSQTWTVDLAANASVQISEILASNQTALVVGDESPDLIELYNSGTASMDLGGYSITDDENDPTKFVFPAGTSVPAGGYLLLVAENAEGFGIRLGFGLNENGDNVYLFDDSPNRQLVDSVQFGHQLADHSISRVNRDGEWGLSHVTLGEANRAVPVADSANTVINEWYATGDIRIRRDFVELYNPNSIPVDIGNHFLSDKPYAIPNQSMIAPLTFIGPLDFVEFIADGDPEDGANHVDFRLSPYLEQIGLLNDSLEMIDVMFSYRQTADVSIGRSPDGASTLEYLEFPTPGLSNSVQGTSEFGFSWQSDWLYENSGTNLGTQWREVDFDDSHWNAGTGPLGNENEPLPVDLETEFEIGPPTFYFRRYFDLPADMSLTQVTAQISTMIDDGVIVYLNGQEVLRNGLADGEIDFDTFANRNVNEAQIEGPFDISLGQFRRTNNVLAAEVHQRSLNSSDLVFGIEFHAQAPLASAGVSTSELIKGLRITEIMYQSAVNGPLDFVEVQNTSDSPLRLDGVRIRGGITFDFPDVVLDAGQFAVIAEDADAFVRHYGRNLNLMGEFSGQLSNSGEEIILQLPNPYDAAILRFDYQSSWLPLANGQGPSIEIVDASLPFDRWGKASSWMHGSLGGTPGYAAVPSPAADWVVINEVLTHTDLPDVDAIELYNPTDASINIGGWYLSDSAAQPRKFQVPENTFIPRNGYVVFDEEDFNSSGGIADIDFALSGAHGDQIWLWQTAEGELRQIVDNVKFGAARNGESFGRMPNGSGRLFPMQETTLGSENSGARVGPVVISEVNYHPADPSAAALAIDPGMDDDDLEFIEIVNAGLVAENFTNWRIRGGADFDFASDLVLSAGTSILVIGFDPALPANAQKLAAFQAHYGIDDSVRIVGPFDGKLDNGDDDFELQRPDDPPLGEPNFIPRLLEDEISYDDSAPWPVVADGGGASLHRIFDPEVGTLATSWNASDPTPGRVEGATVPGDINNDSQVNVEDIDQLCQFIRGGIHDERLDLNADGSTTLDDMYFLVETILGTVVGDVNLDGLFNSTDFVLVFRAGEYEDAIPLNSTWEDGDWNCDREFGTQDLVVAFQRGGYSAFAIADGAAVVGTHEAGDFQRPHSRRHETIDQNQERPLARKRRVELVDSVFTVEKIWNLI